MLPNLILTLAASMASLASAHGAARLVTGDLGGASLGLAQKANTPLHGDNSQTEADTIVFGNKRAAANGLGKTSNNGRIKTAQFPSLAAQALAEAKSNTVPQVSGGGGGSLATTWRQVVVDGAGPLYAVIDTTGTGKFKTGINAVVEGDVPGVDGNYDPQDDKQKQKQQQKQKASTGAGSRFNAVIEIVQRRGLLPSWVVAKTNKTKTKRANNSNVGQEHNITVHIPAGVQCQGQIDGVQGPACLVKIANYNPSQKNSWGSITPFQVAAPASGANVTTTTTTAATTPTSGSSIGQQHQHQRRAVGFVA